MNKIILGTILITVQLIYSISVNTPEKLRTAIEMGHEGDTIDIASGTYTLDKALFPKSKMLIRGAGIQKTILQGSGTWNPGTLNLPGSDDKDAYLFSLTTSVKGIKISNLTCTGPKLHGGIFANRSDTLEIESIGFNNFLWNSIRTIGVSELKIHDCQFINAGGTFKETGGAVFNQWTVNGQFWNNYIPKKDSSHAKYFGFKGRKCNNCRFYNNEVDVDFALEYPFENDKNIEIDHNSFSGAMSIPKYEGGMAIDSPSYSFYIHHNWLQKSYALEWSRNNAIVEYNYFDFQISDDGGNLISGFGRSNSPGPTIFRNNLIKNPGRGIYWNQEPYDHFSFVNNYVKANTLTRKDGLFHIAKGSDFSTILIANNIFELDSKNPRPLLRTTESYAINIENNSLLNISDADKYANPSTAKKRGPMAKFNYKVGVNGRYTVTDWNVSLSSIPTRQNAIPRIKQKVNYKSNSLLGRKKI